MDFINQFEYDHGIYKTFPSLNNLYFEGNKFYIYKWDYNITPKKITFIIKRKSETDGFHPRPLSR